MQFPGNNTHKKILQLLTKHFEKNTNVEAFIVFGSLVRGNWDDYSDLDLDAIVKVDTYEVVQKEINEMTNILVTSGFTVPISFEEFHGEAVFILGTLDRISIRFHTLQDTSPSILDSMHILCGKLTADDLKKSAVVKEKTVNYDLLANKFLELATYVPVSLKRNKPINALFFINKMRQILIQIFIYSRGIYREFDFEKEAPLKLKESLYKTYGGADQNAIKTALVTLLEIFGKEIQNISSEKLSLTDKQKIIISKIKNY